MDLKNNVKDVILKSISDSVAISTTECIYSCVKIRHLDEFYLRVGDPIRETLRYSLSFYVENHGQICQIND
jgi:hypothetical protein